LPAFPTPLAPLALPSAFSIGIEVVDDSGADALPGCVGDFVAGGPISTVDVVVVCGPISTVDVVVVCGPISTVDVVVVCGPINTVDVVELGGTLVDVVELGGTLVDVVELGGTLVDVVELGGTLVDVVELGGTLVDVVELGGTLVDVVVVDEQLGNVIAVSSSVTAPVRTRIRPTSVEPALAVVETDAKMFPANAVSVPSVAEEPICQKTLQAWAPLVRLTTLFAAVVKELEV
jgi:hypothetical protein